MVIYSCLFFLVTYIALSSDSWNLYGNAQTSISLALGILGSEILITNVLKKSNILCFFIFWSFIGILIGNLYLARLTESLVMSQKFDTNLTLVDMIDKNYTIMLISDATSLVLQSKLNDSQYMKFHHCRNSQFCRRLIEDHIDNIISTGIHLDILENESCRLSPFSCEKMFFGNYHLIKLPTLITHVQNYSFLVKELSYCLKNTLFIPNRREIYNVVKPKLPAIAHVFRREFKYLPLSDDTIQTHLMACFTDLDNLIESIVKKYVEHGLYASWANLAAMLSFHWNTGITNQELDVQQVIKLNEKFLCILYSVFIAYIFSMFLLAGEFCYCRDTKMAVAMSFYGRQLLEWFKNAANILWGALYLRVIFAILYYYDLLATVRDKLGIQP